ncbi:MAG: serine/threonine protein kinase [Deltaproteobacteria bacterium]|nr:serine/threonine protein kinase [Deltaproteobacteria bacterium]
MSPGAVREFGKYQLIQRIARGGMAEIFLAAQPGPAGFERFLVIKRILPAFTENEEFVRMFLDEMRIAARLSHPNVGHIYDFGSIDGLYFIAMELIDGVNLRQLILRGHPLPLEHAVRVIAYTCEALYYAHTLNDRSGASLEIVHRDVTPQNIMVSFEGGVKLVDFGIAKATVKAEQTQAGILKGKFSYMSPEQIRGRTIDARSDVFSIGALLYELVTGARLFQGETATDTMDLVTHCRVPRLETVRSGIPAGLQDVVDRAVVAEPDHRYQSARDMQLDLERVMLAGQLVSNSILLAEYLHAIFPERKTEAHGATATGLLAGDQPTQAEAAAPVLPEGWDTNLRTHLAEADVPVAGNLAPTVTGRDAATERGLRALWKGLPGAVARLPATVAGLPARTLWIGAAVVAALIVFAATSAVVASLRQPPVIASEPLGDRGGRIPLLPPPPPRIALPTPAPPPPPASAVAVIVLEDRPSRCEVLVDGSALGGDSTEVPAGRHMITSQGEGCQAETIEVVLRAGDVQAITLRPAPPAPPAPLPVHNTPPNPAGTQRPPAGGTKAPPPSAGDGTLSLRTRPWCKVYDGNRFLGVSPLSGVRLAAGHHTLVLKNPDLGTKRTTVMIRVGRPTTLNLDLNRLFR